MHMHLHTYVCMCTYEHAFICTHAYYICPRFDDLDMLVLFTSADNKNIFLIHHIGIANFFQFLENFFECNHT